MARRPNVPHTKAQVKAGIDMLRLLIGTAEQAYSQWPDDCESIDLPKDALNPAGDWVLKLSRASIHGAGDKVGEQQEESDGEGLRKSS